MKTTFINNTLTVVTPIMADIAKQGIADLAVYDEKTKEPIFTVEVAEGTKGSISKFGIVCNAVVDGKLAIVEVMPMKTTEEDVMKKYGKALVEIKAHTQTIAENAAASKAAIEAIFA